MRTRIVSILAGLGLVVALGAPGALAGDAESDADMAAEEEMATATDVIVCSLFLVGAGAATVATGGIAAPTFLLSGEACGTE